MAKIIIHRKKDWSLKLGYNSTSEVLLDGQRIGYVSGGETTEFDIAPGQHNLKIKMGWYGSRNYNFNLFSKETKSFTVSSMRRYITVAAFPFLVFILLPVMLKIQISQNITNIIIALFMLLVIYAEFFRRSNYIFIRENKGEKANIQ